MRPPSSVIGPYPSLRAQRGNLNPSPTVIASAARQSQPPPTRHRDQKPQPQPTTIHQVSKMNNNTTSQILPTQSPLAHYAPLFTTGVQSTILAGFLSLAVLTPAIAADFSGKLKGVSITDAQATNKAPVAAFTYKKNGDIITFDASSSSDPDGSITKYKWDFGNGTISEGASATYILKDIANLQVTLIVTDNNNGVALSQQTIIPVSNVISDDFSSDTSAQYTAIKGSVSISGGTLSGGGGIYTSNYAIHNTPTGSNDHYVQGKIQTGGSNFGSTIGLRSNGTTGYLVTLNADASRLNLIAFNGNTLTGNPNGNYFKSITGSSGSGSYNVKITISGSTIHAYIDLNNNGSFTDPQEDLGTWTDATYSTGQHIVVGVLRSNLNFQVDNFSGGLL